MPPEETLGPATETAPIQDILRGMFEEVRRYLLGEGLSSLERIGTNPKGEATHAFDSEAEQVALAAARSSLPSFRVLSEESGELNFGEGAPRYTLVMDPCDGSSNFKRGVRAVGFGVAVFAGDVAALDPALVEHALVGDIFNGWFYSASRGKGAFLNGRPIRASSVSELRRAMLCINLGRGIHLPSQPGDEADQPVTGQPEIVWRLVNQASTIRRMGATTLDLCYVAQGAFESYIDLRKQLTPENFLAPALIIQEAGGILGNERGQPVGPVDFTTGYRVLAAGNRELLNQIIQVLQAGQASA